MSQDSGNKADRKRRSFRRTWILVGYDLLILVAVDLLMMLVNPSRGASLPLPVIVENMSLHALCVFTARALGKSYRQVWRYGGKAAYIQLIVLDALAFLAYYILCSLMKVAGPVFLTRMSMSNMVLLLTITIRMLYQYMYEYSSRENRFVNLVRPLTAALTGQVIEPSIDTRDVTEEGEADRKIDIAIIGAGRVGVMLADELMNNPRAYYRPRLFVDTDREKIGKMINGIPVVAGENATQEVFNRYKVQEIVLALPEMDSDRRREMYERYRQTGCKVKTYDYPTTRSVERGKRHLREFDIEELLFRKQVAVMDERTRDYYHGKTVLISGGGGSIGGELCRQIAKLAPRQLIILDVYENGAYDIQQELRILYGARLDLQVEILSVCDTEQLDKVFARYRPQVVLHAAAHKHVPLMEHNCCEAVKNNVFGTLNMVNAAEKYGVEKFIMISTDKAVNPTNVMGATKRMCEMIVQSRRGSKTSFSATRFGNVLGSNGSVIPLFKRQIANGGPVTITDKRIIRYFMTIPEASQLVLQSGAMSSSGELYVLDMGKPVKILELAESMIRLSGYEPYRDINIIETGLRPGEKLYEELLIKTEELDKTDSDLIFVERDKPLSREEIDQKLQLLAGAVASDDDDECREALRKVVPTYRRPEEVNRKAAKAEEMKNAK